jgi:Phage capsid family
LLEHAIAYLHEFRVRFHVGLQILLDRIYRQSPKCAWVMSDAMYKMVRRAKDNNNHPLISVVDGKEILMGKRALVSPSMPSYNPSIGSAKGDQVFTPYVLRRARLDARYVFQ